MDPDFPDDSPVAVALVPCDPHLRAEDQAGKVFLGALAEGLRILRILRSIDSGDADLVLLATSRSFHQYLYKHKPFIAYFDGEETVIDIELTELYFAAQELLLRYRSPGPWSTIDISPCRISPSRSTREKQDDRSQSQQSDHDAR